MTIPIECLNAAKYRLAAARDTLDRATDAVAPHDRHLARQIDLRTHEVDVLLAHVTNLLEAAANKLAGDPT
jgi:hypothetical protein